MTGPKNTVRRLITESVMTKLNSRLPNATSWQRYVAGALDLYRKMPVAGDLKVISCKQLAEHQDHRKKHHLEGAPRAHKPSARRLRMIVDERP